MTDLLILILAVLFLGPIFLALSVMTIAAVIGGIFHFAKKSEDAEWDRREKARQEARREHERQEEANKAWQRAKAKVKRDSKKAQNKEVH